MSYGFRQFHPLVSFFYFLGAVSFIFMFRQPCFLLTAIGLIIGLHVLQGSLVGKASVVVFYGWISIFVLIFNPLVASRGNAPIVELWWGQVITWDGVIYGILAACTLFAMLMWMLYAQYVLRSHQMLYICGLVTPKGALLVAMAMRSFSLLTLRFQQVSTIHQLAPDPHVWSRLQARGRLAMSFIQMMLSWMLEEGMHLADSMKARGYGSGERTQYWPYVFAKRDRIMLTMIASIGTVLIFGWLQGQGQFSIETLEVSSSLSSITMRLFSFTSMEWVIFSGATLYWLLPVIVIGKEKFMWRKSNS
jgi:energy-coupling factor transport system permease protein